MPSEIRRCGSADTLPCAPRTVAHSRSSQSTPLKYGSPHRNLLTCDPYVSQKHRDEQNLREIDEYFRNKDQRKSFQQKLDVNEIEALTLSEETDNTGKLNGNDSAKETAKSDDLKSGNISYRRSLNFDSPCKVRSLSRGADMEQLSIQTSECSRPSSDALLSLQNLWQDDSTQVRSTIFEERQLLKQRLEEERCRRQHCEETIRDLQKKLLEGEEKLAVALKVDREKDAAIKKLKDSWTHVIDQWKTLESQKADMLKQLSVETSRFEEEKADMISSIKRYETELSKALDLAHGYKEKCQTALKEQKTAVRERDMMQLEVEPLREKLSQLEEENSRLNQQVLEAEDALKRDKLKHGNLIEEIAELKNRIKIAESDKGYLKQLKNEKSVLQTNFEECRKRELTLEHQLLSTKNSKAQLKQYYQEQVESIVAKKEKDLQAQLTNIEKQLENKERAISEIANRQVQHLNEMHKLEISVMEEKHSEEIRLHKIRIDQCNEKIEDLRKIVSSQEECQHQLVEKLHSVMENQWKETLKIISSSKFKSETNDIPKLMRQNTFTKEEQKGMSTNKENSARNAGFNTYRINETPQKIPTESKLKDHIDACGNR